MLLKFILLLILCQGFSCGSKKVKRIINGETFEGRPWVYKVIQYHGGIGTLHRIPWWMLTYWQYLQNKARYGYGEIVCSGVLVAPMIFQTACHCLATFDRGHPSFLKPARIRNHFENAAVIYVGLSQQWGHGETMMDWWPIYTERFAIHAKCRGIGKRGSWEIATYDYGLVRLDTSWTLQDWKYRDVEVQFAPHYTDNDIVSFHKYALERQLVCLHIGFGNYRPHELGSDLLRHGWGVLWSQEYCIRFTARVRWHTFSQEQIDNFMNWVCSSKFPNHDQLPADGDSGSPLTCDSRYFGILSGTTEFSLGSRGKEHAAMYGAVANNIFATAINYRYDIIHYLYLNYTTFD